MSIYDYHRRVLSPDIWQSDETTLTSRARSQIEEQVRTRFPTTVGVYLIGDLVGHYWDEESDLDVLVRVPDEDISRYRDDVALASGRKVLPSDHRAYFWLVSDRQKPEVISKHFGPVYDMATQQWYGERVLDINEMTRPDAILRSANWKLYKAKKSLELWPHEYTVEFFAFRELPTERRAKLLDNLRHKTKMLDRKIRSSLSSQADASTWKALEEFENRLFETEEEALPVQAIQKQNLPKHLVQAVLHRFRYFDLLERLEELHKRSIAEQEADEEGEFMATASPYKKSSPSSSAAWTRLDSLITTLISSTGGYTNAPETVMEIITRLLDSKYVNTTARKRAIVYKLYQRYYQGRGASKEKTVATESDSPVYDVITYLLESSGYVEKENDRREIVYRLFQQYNRGDIPSDSDRAASSNVSYEAVLLTGSDQALGDTMEALRQAGYEVSRTSSHNAIVENVLDRSLEDVRWAAEQLGCSVEGVYGEHELEPIAPRMKKAFKLSLQEGKWYFAENAEDIFPLVLVREIKIEKIATDGVEEESQNFTLELLGPEDGLPYQVQMASKQLAKWGLRPATVGDFNELDIIPPEFGQLAKASIKTAAPNVPENGKNFGRLR